MKTFWLALGLGTLIAFSAVAEARSVPPEVLAWYSDSMTLFGTLARNLDRAADATSTVKALETATAALKNQHLASRRKDLRERFPGFFRNLDKVDTAWVPPPEWIRLVQDYQVALANYGEGLVKALARAEDPAVRRALDAFSASVGDLSDSE